MTVTTLLMFLFGIIFQTLWWLKERSSNGIKVSPSDTQREGKDNVVGAHIIQIASKDDVDGKIIHVESREDEYVTVSSTDWRHSTDDMMTNKLNDLIEQIPKIVTSKRCQNLSTKKKEILISLLRAAEGITEEHG